MIHLTYSSDAILSENNTLYLFGQNKAGTDDTMVVLSKEPSVSESLTCSLCHHTVKQPMILHSYKKNQVHKVRVCVQCSSLSHVSKQLSLKRLFQCCLKHPKYASSIFKNISHCKTCQTDRWIEWNGLCPKCGSQMQLKEVSDANT